MEPNAVGRQQAWAQLMKEFDNALSTLKAKENDLITLAKKSINLSLDYLSRLNNDLPQSPDEEIQFYKTVKPHFQSQLLYHKKVYEIESAFPDGNIFDIGYFLQKEIDKLKEFYEKHKILYRYLRSGADFLDFLFFTRGKQAEALLFWIDEIDVNWDTPYESIVSQIKAAELLQEYLLDKLECYNRTNPLNAEPQKMTLRHYEDDILPWTDSKAALVELVYALQKKGAFKNGNAGMNEIAKFVGSRFGVDLSNIHRAIQDILIRQSGPNTYIKQLARHLDDYSEEVALNSRAK